MFVGDARQTFDIADVSGGVADAFAEDGASSVVDQSGDRFWTIVFGEARFDPLTS